METTIINKERIYHKLVQVDEAIQHLQQADNRTSQAQHLLLDRLRRHYRLLLLARAYQEHSC
jgi:hypothetical protein